MREKERSQSTFSIINLITWLSIALIAGGLLGWIIEFVVDYVV